jgi:hypothetical protein
MRLWGDLAVQLRDYGIIFNVMYGRVLVSEANTLRPVSVTTPDIVNGRQRQIVLDEDV